MLEGNHLINFFTLHWKPGSQKVERKTFVLGGIEFSVHFDSGNLHKSLNFNLWILTLAVGLCE